MYKNVLLVRNGCEGCSMETCLGVLLAESFDAKVTAVYVTEDFTWRELRQIYCNDELKWPGAARAGREAQAVIEGSKAGIAKEVLESTEKMCADRQVPCETLHVLSRSPSHGVLELAEEKRCDVIVSSTHRQWAMKKQYQVKAGKAGDEARIPVLLHYAI